MFRTSFRYLALVGAIAVGACGDLVVDNPNAGNTDKLLGLPSDAEALIGSYYKRWHGGLYGTGNPPGNFEGMANIQSFTNYSSLANNCQNARTPFTGAANGNSPGNPCAGDQNQVYTIMNEVVRVSANILDKLNTARDDNTFFLPTADRDLRLRAWAEFLRGISLGYLAMFYDSSAVVIPGQGAVDPGDLISYTGVADSAYAALQRSIDAMRDPAAVPFGIPATWLPTPTSMNAAEFEKLVRSYRARFRANMGRTPTERAAADWTAIIADAQAGISADHLNNLAPTEGMGAGWRRRQLTFGLWHQMPPFIIGMADTSGRYDAWIAQPVGDRGAGNNGFFMITPDLRFPQGGTRALQQADFSIASCDASSEAPCERYFRNRPAGGDEFSGAGWGWSNYDNVKAYQWSVAGVDGTALIGPLPFFTKAEIDLIQAEGLIRQGNFAAAAALINITRTRGMVCVQNCTDADATNDIFAARGGGLPAVTGAADGGPALAGNPDCVPRVPTGSVTQCGDLFEAMKWEKRLETIGSHFGAWYLDHRGWGDLAEGTPLFWAVPYQDLQARGYTTAQLYGAGPGVGNAPNSVAARSNYGW